MKKIIESLKSKWLRETSLTLLLIVIISLAFIGINLWVQSLDLTDIDLTEEKLYTLTDASKEQIAKIPKEDKIEIYMFNYIEKSGIVDLVKQYTQINKNISVEVTTPTNRVDLASKYNIENYDEIYNEPIYTILILAGEKYRVFTNYDLYEYDYNTRNYIDIAEQRLTNGLISVSSIGKTRKVYSLKGHERYSLNTYYNALMLYAEMENYEFQELDLLTQEKMPEDCSVLMICSPETDFTEIEAQKIKDYINEGGSILWMNDPFSSEKKLTNVQSILDMYGVSIDQNGIILEQDESKMVTQNPNMILPNVNSSVITKYLAYEGSVVLFNASKLTFLDDDALSELNVVRTDILNSSSQAFFRTDTTINSLSMTESDEAGQQIIGALLEKSIDEENISKLVIYANNIFSTDYPIQIGEQRMPAIYFRKNIDLVLNSVSYISENEDQIIIRKNIDNAFYTATETQDKVVKVIIFVVPVIIIIIGIVIWQLRRRKR